MILMRQRKVSPAIQQRRRDEMNSFGRPSIHSLCIHVYLCHLNCNRDTNLFLLSFEIGTRRKMTDETPTSKQRSHLFPLPEPSRGKRFEAERTGAEEEVKTKHFSSLAQSVRSLEV